MKTNFIKNAVSFAFLLTSMAAFTAQAGDIRPLHHVCVAADDYIENLGATGTASDEWSFTCPAATSGSFEYQVKAVKSPESPTNVRVRSWNGSSFSTTAAGGARTDSITADAAYSTSFARNKVGGSATYRLKIDKTGTTGNAIDYRLCVRCWQNANEGGADAAPVTPSVPGTNSASVTLDQ